MRNSSKVLWEPWISFMGHFLYGRQGKSFQRLLRKFHNIHKAVLNESWMTKSLQAEERRRKRPWNLDPTSERKLERGSWHSLDCCVFTSWMKDWYEILCSFEEILKLNSWSSLLSCSQSDYWERKEFTLNHLQNHSSNWSKIE